MRRTVRIVRDVLNASTIAVALSGCASGNGDGQGDAGASGSDASVHPQGDADGDGAADATRADASSAFDAGGPMGDDGTVPSDADAGAPIDATSVGDVAAEAADAGTPDAGDDSSGGGSEAGDAGEARDDAGCAPNLTAQTSFVNLAVTAGLPLDHNQSDPLPGDAGAPPAGWNFYLINGAVCRDGSPLGIYAHYTSSTKLYIYLEGGGACNESHFCDHNPANMNQVFPGGEATQGQTVTGSLATVAGIQEPYTTGIFDTTNSANPFQNWNGVYIPY
ncbi:MAG TPA: pectin acetylesterase-family hydrolase [Polyangiaceae bacterium]|nr:pectin acetylesterase-family hydrolase [Polyangiaceae bacterium]